MVKKANEKRFPVTAKRRNAVKIALQKAIRHEEDIVDIAAKVSPALLLIDIY